MAFLVYSQNFVFGSKQGHWSYQYFKSITPIHLWIPLAVLVLLGLSIFLGARLLFHHEKTTLLGCFLIAICIQLLLNAVYPITLAKIVQSDRADSFYSVAMRYSPNEILAHKDTLADSLPLHARANMPGKILLFQLFTIFDSFHNANDCEKRCITESGQLNCGILLTHDRSSLRLVRYP